MYNKGAEPICVPRPDADATARMVLRKIPFSEKNFITHQNHNDFIVG